MQEKVISGNELKVIWAALVAMTMDNHSAQNALTDSEWELAENLTVELTMMMEENSKVK